MKTFFRFATIATFIFTAITANNLFAQKANFDAAQKFSKERVDLMTGSNSVYPRWIKDQNRFWYTYKTDEGKFWYMVDAEKGTKKPLFKRKKMAAQLSETFDRVFNYKDLKLKEFKYNLDKGFFTFHVDSINFEYNVDTQTLIKKDSLEKKPRDWWKTYSPDSTWIAFAKNYNLYLMRADDPDSTEYQLTADGERWYSYQASNGDTTSDKRLRSSARWFEDSNKLYVRRNDVRKVNELWVIHALANPRPTLETYKYAMPGEKHIGKTEFLVFKADTLSSTDGVKLNTEKEEWPDAAFEGSYTGQNSDYLWLIRRNRARNKYEVLKANTATGEAEVLWAETSKPYMNPRLTSLSVINDGEQYLWWSERSGWGQFYRYDSEGNLMNQITEGYYTAGNIAKIDTTNKTIYFQGYGREEGVNPYYSMLYKIKFDGSNEKRLTPENATHRIFGSKKDNYFVDNYSRVDKPTQTVLRNGDGKVIMQLETADVSRLKETGWQPPETFSVKAADGATDLYGVMWKPFDFDSTKTYPVIAYVYPGPQTEPFPVSFGVNSREVSLAQVGFIVVALGQRG
ncbi:MAG TPA: DPP IV N-terminal domain-containing protein, partial [Balneolaceae bacterium]|nr:DPP IV N-terminal domain-containing protein [Balneolaceae bacterium]